MKLPKISKHVYATEPSTEFSWTWVELMPVVDYGMWYKTEAEAISAAKENYLDFPETMKQTVVIVQATNGWNL